MNTQQNMINCKTAKCAFIKVQKWSLAIKQQWWDIFTTGLLTNPTEHSSALKYNKNNLTFLIWLASLYGNIHLWHFFQQVFGFCSIINWSNSPDCYPLPFLTVILLWCNTDPEKVRNPCSFLQFHLISSFSLLRNRKVQSS